MKKDKVIKILKQYNEWRTDKHVPPSSKMIEPSVITEAINRAIELLLSDHINKEGLPVTKIIDAVNSAYKGDIMATISGERPSREEHQYRMIAYHFLYLQGLTQADIGKLFNRNKATVCTTLQNFDNEMNYDDFRSKYDSIFALLDKNNVILQNASRLQRLCKS